MGIRLRGMWDAIGNVIQGDMGKGFGGIWGERIEDMVRLWIEV